MVKEESFGEVVTEVASDGSTLWNATLRDGEGNLLAVMGLSSERSARELVRILNFECAWTAIRHRPLPGPACPNLLGGGVCRVGFAADASAKHPAAQAGLIRQNACPWEGDWNEAERYCPAYPHG